MKKGKLIGKIFGIALVFAMIGAMLGGLPNNIANAATFNIGDTVEVYNTGGSGLLVLDAPCGNVIGGKFDGSRGVVLSGPVYCYSYNRWKIRWENGLEGWSAEDWLRVKYIAPSTKFSINDKVEVYNTGASGLSVRTDPPELAYKGKVYDSDAGTVKAGPFYGVPKGSSGFYYFWRVDYGSTSGWCAEDWLKIQPPNQAPTCSLSANPTSGNVPLDVTFTMSASDPDGSISVWGLDADGDASFDYSGAGNPPSTQPHKYTTLGTYIAAFMVLDNDGANCWKTVTIVAGENEPPTCSLSPDKSSGKTPLAVTFSISASDSDGWISSWELDPDDGSPTYSGMGNPPSTKAHTYTAAGTYTAILGVTDNEGATRFDNKTITVSAPSQGPTADFSADVTSCCDPLTVHFTDLSAAGDNPIVSWYWDFGDGYDSTAENPSHIYDDGVYTVSLTVTDSHGCSDTEVKENYITSNEGPTAAFSANPTSGYRPLMVQFTDLSTAGDNPIVSWYWEFDDGDTNTAQNPSHIYNNAGTYTVTLTVTDEHGCSDDATTSVIVTVGDATPPTVYSVSPQNGQPDVAIDAVVTATFSEAMDGSTITADSFTLAGSAVSGTVEYDPVTSTATFTPSANLEYDHTYTARLSVAITDEAGNGLDGDGDGMSEGSPEDDYIWSFTTESAVVYIGSLQVPAHILTFSGSEGSIIDITFDKSEYRPGDTVEINVEAKNTGVARTECFVDVYIIDPSGKVIATNDAAMMALSSLSEENPVQWLEPGANSIFGPFKYHLPKKFLFSGGATPGIYHVLAKLSTGVFHNTALDYRGIDLVPPEETFQVIGEAEITYEEGGNFKRLKEEIELFRQLKERERTAFPVCLVVPDPDDPSQEINLVLIMNPGEPIVHEYKKVTIKTRLTHPLPTDWSITPLTLYVRLPSSLGGCAETWFARKVIQLSTDFPAEVLKELAWFAGEKVFELVTGVPIPPGTSVIYDIGCCAYEGYTAKFKEDIPPGQEFQVYLPVGLEINVGAQAEISCPGMNAQSTIALSQGIKGEKAVTISQDLNEIQIDVPIGAYALFNDDYYLLEWKDMELFHQFKIDSPVAVRVYDSQGRVTGVVEGQIRNKIPKSVYDVEDETIRVFGASELYRYEVTGEEEGEYGASAICVEGGESAATFVATEIPTAPGATHQYTIDWDALSEGEAGVTVQVDSDGDGITDYTLTAGNVLTGDDFIPRSGCFIATAAYGTPMAEEIEILRGFRDEYLLTHPVGKGLVEFYYKVSPPIAEFITEHPSLKPIVRGGLLPAVAMSAVAVNTTPAEKTAIIGLLALVSVAVAVWAMRRRRRGPEYT